MTRRTDIPLLPFPLGAGLLLGLGIGGLFDGIVLHQVLQWHHVAAGAGPLPGSVEALRSSSRLDGLVQLAAYAVTLLGLLWLWRVAHYTHQPWSSRLLLGSILMGFGIFNLVEGLVSHHLLGLHHVNETVPRGQWLWWDLGFLLWGAGMLAGGWAMLREGRRRTPGERGYEG